MNTLNALARLRPRSQHQYRRLPLFGRIMDAFAQWSLDQGFSIRMARFHVEALMRLVPWFQRRRKRSVADLSAGDIEEARRYYRHRYEHRAAGARKLGEFLRSRGWLKPDRPPPPTPTEQEVSRYTEHLRQECALAEGTIRGHRSHLQRFLRFLHWDQTRLPPLAHRPPAASVLA